MFLVPFIIISNVSDSRSSIGTSIRKEATSDNEFNWLMCHEEREPPLDQPSIPPSSIVFDLSGITKSGSTTILKPNPVHVPQAPWGLLKLKVLGSISPMLTLQYTHEKASEKIISSFPEMSTNTIPPACFKAASVESLILTLSIFSVITSLSTTTSMSCHFCLSSSKFSLRSFISPFTRTRTKPDFLADSNTSLCSPFLLLTTGDNIWMRLEVGNPVIESTICWTV